MLVLSSRACIELLLSIVTLHSDNERARLLRTIERSREISINLDRHVLVVDAQELVTENATYSA